MKCIMLVHYAGQDQMRGSEMVALQTVERLAKRLYPVVLVTNHQRLLARARAVCTDTMLIDFGQVCMANKIPTVVEVKRICGLAQRHGVELIHANAGAAFPMSIKCADYLSVPVVGHLHAPYSISDRFRYGLNRMNHLICVSQDTADSLRWWVSKPNQISVVYNAVEPASPPMPKVRLADQFNLVCVSALSPEKGVDRVLEAFKLLKTETNVPCHLTVAGDGPLRDELIGMAGDLGITQHVTFLGHVRSVDSLLSQADLMVLGSRAESFGLVVLEAGLQSVPTIAPAVGGLPEVISDGQSGRLVANGTARELADAAKPLMTNPSALAAMGQGSLLQAQRFGPERFTDELERVYAQVFRESHAEIGVSYTKTLLQLVLNQWNKRVAG